MEANWLCLNKNQDATSEIVDRPIKPNRKQDEKLILDNRQDTPRPQQSHGCCSSCVRPPIFCSSSQCVPEVRSAKITSVSWLTVIICFIYRSLSERSRSPYITWCNCSHLKLHGCCFSEALNAETWILHLYNQMGESLVEFGMFFTFALFLRSSPRFGSSGVNTVGDLVWFTLSLRNTRL